MKAAHEKHIWAFKEYCISKLDTFFEQHGLEFADPDEDVALSDSQESEFVYDLPEGYDSGDEGNPEFISVISSGNSSEGSELRDGIGSISMLNIDSLQGEISNAGRHSQAGAGDSNKLSLNVREKIRVISARR